MNGPERTRRALLGLAIALPAIARAARASAQQAACVPATLPGGQQSMRRSLGYVAVSDDPKRLCKGCSYTAVSSAADCGKCQLLNGAVPAGARCNSWAPKR